MIKLGNLNNPKSDSPADAHPEPSSGAKLQQPRAHIDRSNGKACLVQLCGGLFRSELAALRSLSYWERRQSAYSENRISTGNIARLGGRIRSSTPNSFHLLEVEEVSSGEVTVSAPRGNVEPTANCGPNDRGGEIEGGGVNTHAAPTRRSSRLASQGSNPVGRESVYGSRRAQSVRASTRGRRAQNSTPARRAPGASSPSAAQAQQDPTQGHSNPGQGGNPNRRRNAPGVP
ncbi:hypothetical protein C8F04DRAFT_1181784 [Mycena alexandri]|uniref:Uncharacterized protein n=1 Tax=Mycena alexandri TaxID=1745969 RepID=A0AAD6SZP2_9AGAR|nr:hypothetical protein C8F04DRAFT_1181784 [Mycena alexandri]